MAIGIKVFPLGIGGQSLQEQINEWLQKEKPKDIINMAASESVIQKETDAFPTYGMLCVAYKTAGFFERRI